MSSSASCTDFDCKNLQSSTENNTDQPQPAPARRKRLLLLPALPAARRLRGGTDSGTQTDAPAAAEAPSCELHVVPPAEQNVQYVPLDAPLARQSQRQLRAPFLKQQQQQERPAWQGTTYPSKGSASIGVDSQHGKPPNPETEPRTAVAQPLQDSRELLAQAAPLSSAANVSHMASEGPAQPTAGYERRQSRMGLITPTIEPADVHAAHGVACISLGAVPEATEDGDALGPPLAIGPAWQSDAARVLPPSAAAPAAETFDGHALILDDDIARETASAGPTTVPMAASEPAAGQTIVPAFAAVSPPLPVRHSDMMPPVHKSCARHVPVGVTQGAASAAQKLDRSNVAASPMQPRPDATSPEASPCHAASQPEAGDAAAQQSPSQPADVQQPLHSQPVQVERPTKALPPLPMLPAVTTASLPSVDEVLAPYAIPAASALIGAV